MIIKTYSQLLQLPTFKERFDYVALNGRVGEDTFGIERYLNQQFYRSREWRKVRNEVMVRDGFGEDYVCDLAHPDRPIRGRVIVHHLNPITIEDIELSSKYLLDPEFLVCVSELTHNAIHFGDFSLIPQDYTPRRPNDTCPWRQ